MTRYRIFQVWNPFPDHFRAYDTGMTVEAPDVDRACELAVMRGVCSGLGKDPTYHGIAAYPIDR